LGRLRRIAGVAGVAPARILPGSATRIPLAGHSEAM
jgi:hypothetical protein